MGDDATAPSISPLPPTFPMFATPQTLARGTSAPGLCSPWVLWPHLGAPCAPLSAIYCSLHKPQHGTGKGDCGASPSCQSCLLSPSCSTLHSKAAKNLQLPSAPWAIPSTPGFCTLYVTPNLPCQSHLTAPPQHLCKAIQHPTLPQGNSQHTHPPMPPSLTLCLYMENTSRAHTVPSSSCT